MIKAHLIRTKQNKHYTRGVLVIKGDVFHTLELPWKDNARSISCIPAGTYKSVYLSRTHSRKYNSVYHLQSVDGRSGILIHNGNIVDHTDGCILIGLHMGELGGEPAVLNSRTALAQLNELMQKEDFELEIMG